MKDDEPRLTAPDFVLGEGSQSDRAALREALEADLAQVLEVAETRDLLERFREIAVEPTGRVEREMRRIWQHRLRIRRPSPRPWGPVVELRSAAAWRRSLAVGLRVAAVAVVSLGIGWTALALLRPDAGGGARNVASQGDWSSTPVAHAELPMIGRSALDQVAATAAREALLPDPELRELLDADLLPVDAPSFVESAERFAATPVPDDYFGLMSAENVLAQLRAESHLRFSPAARDRARHATGVPDLEDRVQALAAVVAARVGDRLDATGQVDGDLEPDAIAFALRALVAAGSSLDVGPHRAAVAACRDRLLDLLATADRIDLSAGARATALAALAELAVLGDADAVARVAIQGERVAREVLRGSGPTGGRPGLLHWQTPVHQLADAGRLLWIAPAFGTHAGLAFRARLMIAAHLGERLRVGASSEQPALVAAQLYGFGDLIDRSEADRRLSLWRPQLLLPDFVAMHHVAWSKYPVRPGWAEFQRQLRTLAGEPTPEGLKDASALLLSLCTNVAAPGVSESLRARVL